MERASTLSVLVAKLLAPSVALAAAAAAGAARRPGAAGTRTGPAAVAAAAALEQQLGRAESGVEAALIRRRVACRLEALDPAVVAPRTAPAWSDPCASSRTLCAIALAPRPRPLPWGGAGIRWEGSFWRRGPSVGRSRVAPVGHATLLWRVLRN